MISGIITGFLTGLLGWQINLISLHHGMDRGKRAAFFVGMGAVLADLIWIFAAFLGAKTLLSTHHEYFRHVKWLGIITIAFAGLRILFHNSKTKAEEPKTDRLGHAKNFILGFLIVMLNPAMLVMWIGVIGFILTHIIVTEPDAFYHWLFMTGFLAGGTAWFLILAMVLMPRIRKWTDERFHLISKCFAAALLLGAGILVFKKF